MNCRHKGHPLIGILVAAALLLLLGIDTAIGFAQGVPVPLYRIVTLVLIAGVLLIGGIAWIREKC